MPDLVVTIGPGEPRRKWCNRCLTSAGYEVDVFMLTINGLTSLGTISGCERCEPDDAEHGQE